MGFNQLLQKAAVLCCVCALCLPVLSGCGGGPRPKTTTDPARLTSAMEQAATIAEQNQNHETAVERYASLLRGNPDNLGYLLGLARNLRYGGQTEEAMRVLYARVKDFDKNARFMAEYGRAQIAANLSKSGLEALKKSLELDPDNWQTHMAAGIANDTLKQFGEAQYHYETALNLSPGNPSVINNLALSLANAGQMADAIDLLENIVEGPGGNVQHRQNLALLYALTGKLLKAESLARRDLPPDMAEENIRLYRQLAEEHNL